MVRRAELQHFLFKTPRCTRAVGLGEEEPDLLCRSPTLFSIKLKYMLNMDCELSRSRIQ